MEDNNKLFVFEKKEVVLIFVFVVLISVISFTLGVRTGKSLSLKHDQYSEQDIKSIDLKSVEEEYVDSVVKSSVDVEESADANAKTDLKVEERLREEMEKLAAENPQAKSEGVSKDIGAMEQSISEDLMNEDPAGTGSEDNVDLSASNRSDLAGKYTIQLFAHQSEQVAQDFADGFLAKGYDVIINEVAIAGKGKWFRVSIGVFNNVNEAKDYLQNEKNLFQDKNYIIKQF